MMTNVAGETFSDLAVHPGVFLAEEIEARGMSQRALAREAGRPVQTINEIVRGKKSITADTAVALERALGLPATLWMNLQTTYELTLAYHRAQEALADRETTGGGMVAEARR